MLRTRLIVLFAVLAASAVAQVVSPQLHPGGKATLRLNAPRAKQVKVLGDWIKPGRTVDMTPGADGVWSATVGPLEPGAYIYSFELDGRAMPDPVNPAAKLRSAGVGSLLHIPGDPLALWEARDVPHGEVRIRFEKSQALRGETRWMFIYTPPGYDQNQERRYPVLYLLHGSNDTAAGWVMVGAANYILDNLIAQGDVKEMIVVMPYGHAVPYGLPRELQAKNTELFERYLLEELMPLVESDYRTLSGSANRALVGLSMGGGQSLAIGFGNLDLFDAIGAYSASVPSDFETRFSKQLADAAGVNESLDLLWFACGKDDRLLEGSQELSELLQAKGVKHAFKATEGTHNYAVWRRYFAETAPLLFRGGN